jgi:hypothetical protein
MKFLHQNAGTAAIEFALLAPIFFLLIYGILEFAIVMYVSSVVENATSSASRLGLTGSDYTGNTRADTNAEGKSREEFIASEIDRLAGGLVDSARVRVSTEIRDDFGSVTIPQEELENCKEDGPADCNFGTGTKAVLYKVEYPYHFQAGILRSVLAVVPGFLNDEGDYVITAYAVVQNENF